jgi:hypothetical protein
MVFTGTVAVCEKRCQTARFDAAKNATQTLFSLLLGITSAMLHRQERGEGRARAHWNGVCTARTTTAQLRRSPPAVQTVGGMFAGCCHGNNVCTGELPSHTLSLHAPEDGRRRRRVSGVETLLDNACSVVGDLLGAVHDVANNDRLAGALFESHLLRRLLEQTSLHDKRPSCSFAQAFV